MSPETEAVIQRHALYLIRRLGIGYGHARLLATMAFTATTRRA